MDKQKQIAEMATIVRTSAQKALQDGYVNTVDDDVLALVNAGYGNLKELAEMLKAKSSKKELICSGGLVNISYIFNDAVIDDVLKEFTK